MTQVGRKLKTQLKFMLNVEGNDYIYPRAKDLCFEEIPAYVIGGAAVGASLLRGCIGALPPWAIESLPNVFSALFKSVGG